MKTYQKTINGELVIKPQNKIVIHTEDYQIINPTEEMILADGWVEYVPPTPDEPVSPPSKPRSVIIEELVAKSYNERTDIPNNEALDYVQIIYPWHKYIGQTLVTGKIVVYDNKPWRVRQEHIVMDIYPPSVSTAALYEAIDKEHTGELDDPIPYTPPMEIFKGKYYTQNGVMYLCTRNSETALSHDLSALVGLYVEVL